MKKVFACLALAATLSPSIVHAEIRDYHVNGSLLLLEDDERADPIAVDLSNPQVRAIIGQAQNHAIPGGWNFLLSQFAAVDPKMYTRCTALGQGTSMGPAIPGFTVVPPQQRDCPR